MAVKHLRILPDELEERLEDYGQLDEIMAYERVMARLEAEAVRAARAKAKTAPKPPRRSYNRG